jgi:hypothetical protein
MLLLENACQQVFEHSASSTAPFGTTSQGLLQWQRQQRCTHLIVLPSDSLLSPAQC